MDEMKLKLTSKFMRGVAEKIITKLISDKFGFKPEIRINDIEIGMVNNRVHFHIDVAGSANRDELLKTTKLIDFEELM